MTENIVCEKHSGLLTLIINRPEKKNALTNQMYAGLVDGFSAAAQDHDIKVVLLKGSGGIFSSGNDLKDLSLYSQNPESFHEFAGVRLMKQLIGFPKPVVAAVKGLAFGIGTTMLLHCDLVVAGRGTKFSLPFVKLGLVPEFASSYLLPLLAGKAQASQAFLLGEPFGVEEAYQMGIISQVCEDDQVDAHALTVCQKLCNLPANTIQAIKGMINPPEKQVKLLEVIESELSAFQKGLMSMEHHEAMAAFFEKRAPKFPTVEE